MRYSTTNHPLPNTEVTLIPVSFLTQRLLKIDKEHPYYCEELDQCVSGTVITEHNYINNFASYEHMHHIDNLIPVQISSVEAILVPPCFLVSDLEPRKVSRGRRAIDKLLDRIQGRIEQLKSHN